METIAEHDNNGDDRWSLMLTQQFFSYIRTDLSCCFYLKPVPHIAILPLIASAKQFVKSTKYHRGKEVGENRGIAPKSFEKSAENNMFFPHCVHFYSTKLSLPAMCMVVCIVKVTQHTA